MTRALCAKFKSVRLTQSTGSETGLLLLGGACIVQAHMKGFGGLFMSAPLLRHLWILAFTVYKLCLPMYASIRQTFGIAWPEPPRHRRWRGQAPCPHQDDRNVDGIDSNVTADMDRTKTFWAVPLSALVMAVVFVQLKVLARECLCHGMTSDHMIFEIASMIL